MYCSQERCTGSGGGIAGYNPAGVLTAILLAFFLAPSFASLVWTGFLRVAALPAAPPALPGIFGSLIPMLIAGLLILAILRMARRSRATDRKAHAIDHPSDDGMQTIRGLQAGLDRMEARIEALEVLLLDSARRGR